MNEYWRSRLDRAAGQCYDKLLRGVRNMMREVDCGNLDVNSLQSLYLAVFYDHPEFFYMNSAHQISQHQSGFAGFGSMSVSNRILLSPIYTATEIRHCTEKINRAKAEIKRQAAACLTDEEKVILVAEYLVRNTEYEINNRLNQNAAAALCFGRAQCSGIAKAFKLLMDELGVWCIFVEGDATDEKGERGPHAWNIVRLGSNYYHVDVTFMLGANGNRCASPNRIYLFYDDAKISSDHTWDRSRLPACTDGAKAINDFENGRFRQGGATEARGATGTARRADVPVYSSLSQLRNAVKGALQKREASVSFYVDLGEISFQELNKSVQNALRMVVENAQISCGVSISGSSDGFFELDIEY